MQMYQKTLISLTAGLMLLAATPVLAEDGGQGMQRGPEHGPIQTFIRGIVSGRPPRIESFAGKVASVQSPSFTLEIPGLGREGTTTITVVTNASTTFSVGTSTASFADITAAGFASASGSFATTTKTLTAFHVSYQSDRPRRGEEIRLIARDQVNEHLNNGWGRDASSTDDGQEHMASSTNSRAELVSRIVTQFSASTTPDVIRGIINSFFGGLSRFFHR